jgi:hypothetical protein
MRNRRKTIESLKRLAERPGTKHEGVVAHQMLKRMLGNIPDVIAFRADDFPAGTTVFYNYWAYPENDVCLVMSKSPKIIHRQTWLRLAFIHLRRTRWVPVTSAKGCHISKTPLSSEDAHYMYSPYEEAPDIRPD